MSAFVVAAAALLVAAAPAGRLLWRGTLLEAVVAYELLSAVVVMELVLLPVGFGRSGEMELPVLSAVLLLGGGLVLVRALERWL